MQKFILTKGAKTRLLSAVLLLATGSSNAGETGAVDGFDYRFYGKFDISLLQNSGTYNAETKRVEHDAYSQSNGSRTGLKTQYTFDNGFTVFGQLEYAVDFRTDVNNHVEFTNRNSYVGIGGSWGKLQIGQNDSPLKMAQGNIDLFSDSDSQMWPLQRGENRVSDIMEFRSVAVNNFSVNAMVANNPERATSGYGLSVALQYDFNGVFTSISFDQDIVDYDVLRWVGSYTYEDVTVSALIQESTSTQTDESDRGYTLSSSYQLSEFTLKLQLTHSDEIIEGGQFITAGIDWRYTDSILFYTFYTDRSSDDETGEGDLWSLAMKYRF